MINCALPAREGARRRRGSRRSVRGGCPYVFRQGPLFQDSVWDCHRGKNRDVPNPECSKSLTVTRRSKQPSLYVLLRVSVDISMQTARCAFVEVITKHSYQSAQCPVSAEPEDSGDRSVD